MRLRRVPASAAAEAASLHVGPVDLEEVGTRAESDPAGQQFGDAGRLSVSVSRGGAGHPGGPSFLVR